MMEKLRALDLHYADVEARLSAPETYEDPALVARLNKEQRELEPVVMAYRAYQRRRQDLEDAEALMGDPDMKELAQEEYQQAREELARLEATLRTLLRPKDPMEGKNVIFGDPRRGMGGRRQPSSPPTSTGCTPCMGRSRDGSGRWSPPTRPSWEGSRNSPA